MPKLVDKLTQYFRDPLDIACEKQIQDGFNIQTAPSLLLDAFLNASSNTTKKANTDYQDLIIKHVSDPANKPNELDNALRFDQSSFSARGQLDLLDAPVPTIKYDDTLADTRAFKAIFGDPAPLYFSMKESDKARFFLIYRSMLQNEKTYTAPDTPEREKFNAFFLKALEKHRYLAAQKELDALLAPNSRRDYVFDASVEGCLTTLRRDINTAGDRVPNVQKLMVMEAACAFIKDPKGLAGSNCFKAIETYADVERGEAWGRIWTACKRLFWVSVAITALALCIAFPVAGAPVAMVAVYGVSLAISSLAALALGANLGSEIRHFPKTEEYKDKFSGLKELKNEVAATKADKMKELLIAKFETAIDARVDADRGNLYTVNDNQDAAKARLKTQLREVLKGQIFTDVDAHGHTPRAVTFTVTNPTLSTKLNGFVDGNVDAYGGAVDPQTLLDQVKNEYEGFDFNVQQPAFGR